MRSLVILGLATLVAGACRETSGPKDTAEQPRFSLVPLEAIQITDLGFAADPRGLNDVGEVVGGISGGVCPGQCAFTWTATSGLQVIGPEGENSIATDVNNEGVVAAVFLATSSQPGGHTDLGYTWAPGVGWQALGPMPGGDDSYPVGINNVEQIAGNGQSHSRPNSARGFVWDQQFQVLPTLGGSFSAASDINDASHVVGASATTGSTPDVDGPVHAFLWTAEGGMRDLGNTLGGAYSGAGRINGLDAVAGEAETATGEYHVFLWTETQGMQDLGFGGNVRGMNDLGQIVGCSPTCGGRDAHAYLWDPDRGFQWLPELDGTESSQALAVNNLGQVVGYDIRDAGLTVVLWNTRRPASPSEETAILHSAVQRLMAAGLLNKGQAQSLAATLNAADRCLAAGKLIAASNALTAFVNQVRALIAAGVLKEGDGDPLIDAAQHAIEQLASAD